MIHAKDNEQTVIEAAPRNWIPASGNPWSPDGKRIAIIQKDKETYELLLAPAGKKPAAIVKSKHALTSPFWSRDGQVIFYVENTARSVGYFISTEPVIPVGGGDSPADARPAQTASRSTTPAIAPDFSASDLSGERVNLEQLKGKVTVLHFWSTLRECEEDLHILQRLGDRYGNRGLSVVGLADNCTSREVVRSVLAKRGIRMTTLMSSPEIAGRYHVATHPTTYVLDETGKIRYWMYGILTEEHWAKQIERLLN